MGSASLGVCNDMPVALGFSPTGPMLIPDTVIVAAELAAMVPLANEKEKAAAWKATVVEKVRLAPVMVKLGAGDVTKKPSGNPNVMESVPLTRPPTDDVNAKVMGMFVAPATALVRSIVRAADAILFPIGGLGN